MCSELPSHAVTHSRMSDATFVSNNILVAGKADGN